jgi:hypothetical protein
LRQQSPGFLVGRRQDSLAVRFSGPLPAFAGHPHRFPAALFGSGNFNGGRFTGGCELPRHLSFFLADRFQ